MLRKLVRRILFPYTYSSSAYIRYLKKNGVEIGEGSFFWAPNKVIVDLSRPHLISIGKYCKITSGVTILAHDYSRSVIRYKYGENIGMAKKTLIGDNCFLGMNSTILMGSKIGNNCIIGAGSVVSGYFGDDCVIAGNPAKVISSLEVYYNRKKDEWIQSAIIFAEQFFLVKKRIPTIIEMGNEFAWLYLDRTQENIAKYPGFFILSGDDNFDLVHEFMTSKKSFESYDSFLTQCNFERKT